MTAIALVTVLGLGTSLTQAAEDETQYPLGSAQLKLSSGSKPSARRLAFSAKWTGQTAAMPNPMFTGATLRVVGGTGEGDSGLISLPGGNWKSLPKQKGYRYTDKQALAGGIKMIEVRLTKTGGRVKIQGGKQRWGYEVAKPQSQVTVTLISGDVRWCAQFTSPTTKKTKVSGKAPTAPATCPCDTFASTFEAIQSVVFERNGCLSSGCHDSARSGGLDLRKENAYASLMETSLFGVKRIEPYSPQESFLWQKLAAASGSFDLAGKGSPMPSGLPPISQSEMDAIRQWILKGAAETGVVAGTETLLDSCLPPPEPPVEDPLAPPGEAEGVQLYAPPWEIPVRKEAENGENEICYSTYYNLTGKVPPQYLVPCPAGIFDGPTNPTKQCFTYDHQLLRQSANSHHSIIHIYNGVHPANDPGWGNQCSGGTVPDGTACDPTQPGVPAPAGGDCGGGHCRGKVVKTIACAFGYGPADYMGGVAGNGSAVAPSFSGSQQPRFERQSPPGVFSILPVEGTIVWNSHAFNIFDQPIYNQQWLNLWYTDDLRYPVQGIFDSADIFIQSVKPFQEVEYCRTVLFGKGTRIADFSSHTHQRGRLFRVWGPGIAQPCRSTTANPGACLPEPTPPIMTTVEYNDPAQLIYDPPLALDSDDPVQRRFKFCSIFDNGYNDPATVKRNSSSPDVLLGGKCYTNTSGRVIDKGISCLDGPMKGQPCQGNDRACDSSPGANDGVCDTCTLTGGVSTEDEMFILIGSRYCDPAAADPVECRTRQNGSMTCNGGPDRGQDCTTAADCRPGCEDYSNR